MPKTDQQSREALMAEVGDTILAIEMAERRCAHALADLAHDAEPNVRLALEDAAAGLARVRLHLQQRAYFGRDQQRLFGAETQQAIPDDPLPS